MEFLHASVALLASMVLILAGMVGWLYYQQTRMFQNMNSLAMILGELAQPRIAMAEYAPPPEPVAEETAPAAEEEDDRVSVDDDATEIVDGAPAPLDTDGLEAKSKKELQDLLTKRGIPFSKGDNKTTLVNLLKATA